MNPMFRSYLQSMQIKSQDAQNPGLWVNGNRMPIQEGKGNMDKEKVIDPMGNGLDGLPASTTGAAARSMSPTTRQVWNANSGNRNPARVNVENLYREDARMNPNGNPDIYNPLTNVADAEIELMAKQIARGNLSGGRAPGAMQPEPMQEELARKLDPSASSFFKPKSGRNNYLKLVAPPVDADGNREVTPEEAARSAALSAEIDASVRADRVRAQLQDRDKVVTDTRNPLEYAKDSTYDELDQRAAAIKRRRAQGLPVYSPDSAYEQDQNSAKAVVAGLQEENINHPIGLPLITFTNSVKKGFPNASVEERGKMVDDMMKAWNNRNKSKANKPKSKSAPMQENTNRSMFLTHLQGMQTKSQDAQNPGLWVNGNRMPMQEAVKKSAVPVKLVDADTNREVTPDEANMHADAAAAGTSTNRLGSEIGHHPLDVNDDGAVVPEERRTNAAPAENWATMAARHVSRQAANPGTGLTPPPASRNTTVGSDGY